MAKPFKARTRMAWQHAEMVGFMGYQGERQPGNHGIRWDTRQAAIWTFQLTVMSPHILLFRPDFPLGECRTKIVPQAWGWARTGHVG